MKGGNEETEDERKEGRKERRREKKEGEGERKEGGEGRSGKNLVLYLMVEKLLAKNFPTRLEARGK